MLIAPSNSLYDSAHLMKSDVGRKVKIQQGNVNTFSSLDYIQATVNKFCSPDLIQATYCKYNIVFSGLHSGYCKYILFSGQHSSHCKYNILFHELHYVSGGSL